MTGHHVATGTDSDSELDVEEELEFDEHFAPGTTKDKSSYRDMDQSSARKRTRSW